MHEEPPPVIREQVFSSVGMSQITVQFLCDGGGAE